MFLRRALLTLVLGPLVILLIYLGGLFYFIPFLLLILLASYEYTTLMAGRGWRVTPIILLPFVAALLVDGQWSELELLIPLLVGAAFISMCYGLWLYERRDSKTAPADWLAMVAGILLLGGVGSYFFRLRGIPEFAWQWTTMAMVGTWVADSGAYLVGKSLGRHKLSPKLSPNKTVEGYLGGILFGVLVTVILGFVFNISLPLSLFLGLLVSAVSPAGDLGISLLKREAGVKDSGRFLPGHGGALDRIDTLLWSVTFAFFIAQFL